MISKELLSLVLGYEIYTISILKDNRIFNTTGNTEKYAPNLEWHNIHEVAHKCKEWAYDNGYEIESFYTEHTYQSSNEATGEEPEFNSIKQALVRVVDTKSNSRKVLKHYYANEEAGAIFKACRWVWITRINNGK